MKRNRCNSLYQRRPDGRSVYHNSDGSVWVGHVDPTGIRLRFTRNKPMRAYQYTMADEWLFLDPLAGAQNVGKAVWFLPRDGTDHLWGFVVDVRLRQENMANKLTGNVKYEYAISLYPDSAPIPRKYHPPFEQAKIGERRCWVYGEASALGLVEDRATMPGKLWKSYQERRLLEEAAHVTDPDRWEWCVLACRVKRVSRAHTAPYENLLVKREDPQVSNAYKFHLPARTKFAELKRPSSAQPSRAVKSGITVTKVLKVFQEHGTVSDSELQSIVLAKYGQDLDKSIVRGSAGRPRWKKLLETLLSRHKEKEAPAEHRRPAYWKEVILAGHRAWKLTPAGRTRLQKLNEL